MTPRKVRVALVVVVVTTLLWVAIVPSSSAHNPSVPSECNRVIDGSSRTTHSLSVTDFTGTPRTVFGAGENVHINAFVSGVPAGHGTDVNRVRYVWIDPTGAVVHVAVLPRRRQLSSEWSVVAGITAVTVSAQPFGTWHVFACYETPNHETVKGVTLHIDEAAYTVQ